MSHDYHPEWDYVLANLAAADALLVQCAAEQVARDVAPLLGMPAFQVFCVEQGGFGDGVVGRFVSGTASLPVVGVDVGGLREAAVVYGVDFADQLRATLVHELAHAVEEQLSDDVEHDENVVETFARNYVLDGVVDVALLGLTPVSAVEHCAVTFIQPEEDVTVTPDAAPSP